MYEAQRLRSIAATAAAAAERWSLPTVEGPIVGGRKPPGADSEQARREQEAERARGYQAGVAAAQETQQRLTSELQARVERFDSLLSALTKPVTAVDEAVERQLLALALAIGKQLARRALQTDSGEIINLIRESVGRLPAPARDVRVHVHPDDAATVREHLAQPAAERAWTLVEDPTQTRGGCLVLTETSRIDQRFEQRVNAIVCTLLGDERATDRSPGPSEPGTPS